MLIPHGFRNFVRSLPFCSFSGLLTANYIIRIPQTVNSEIAGNRKLSAFRNLAGSLQSLKTDEKSGIN